MLRVNRVESTSSHTLAVRDFPVRFSVRRTRGEPVRLGNVYLPLSGWGSTNAKPKELVIGDKKYPIDAKGHVSFPSQVMSRPQVSASVVDEKGGVTQISLFHFH